MRKNGSMKRSMLTDDYVSNSFLRIHPKTTKMHDRIGKTVVVVIPL